MSVTQPSRATYPAPSRTEAEDVGRVVLAGSWLEHLLAALLATVRAGTAGAEAEFASIAGSQGLVGKLRDAFSAHPDVELLTEIVDRADSALADRHSYAHGSFATTPDGQRVLYRGNPGLARKLGFNSNGVQYPYSHEDARERVAEMMMIASDISDYLGIGRAEG